MHDWLTGIEIHGDPRNSSRRLITNWECKMHWHLGAAEICEAQSLEPRYRYLVPCSNFDDMLGNAPRACFDAFAAKMTFKGV